MNSFLDKEEFKKLEKDFPFLSRAREVLGDHPTELEEGNFTIIDIETTGLDPAQHEIIELAALKISQKQVKAIFNTLVFPQKPIPPHITQINGISNEMVASYPGIKSSINDFKKFIGTDILIAHNTDFDINFIQHHCLLALGQPLSSPNICTLKLARFLLPNLINYKLSTIAHYLKIPTPNAHRAIGDCETTFQIWLKLLELLKKKDINSQSDLQQLGLIC
jgi:DNA polymerase III epsilon subunit family exonuclease